MGRVTDWLALPGRGDLNHRDAGQAFLLHSVGKNRGVSLQFERSKPAEPQPCREPEP